MKGWLRHPFLFQGAFVSELSSMGKWLFLAGLGLAFLGLVIWGAGKLPFLGRLPGDIRFEGDHFKFYFPLATGLLLSVILSFILWAVSKFK